MEAGGAPSPGLRPPSPRGRGMCGESRDATIEETWVMEGRGAAGFAAKYTPVYRCLSEVALHA